MVIPKLLNPYPAMLPALRRIPAPGRYAVLVGLSTRGPPVGPGSVGRAGHPLGTRAGAPHSPGRSQVLALAVRGRKDLWRGGGHRHRSLASQRGGLRRHLCPVTETQLSAGTGAARCTDTHGKSPEPHLGDFQSWRPKEDSFSSSRDPVSMARDLSPVACRPRPPGY